MDQEVVNGLVTRGTEIGISLLKGAAVFLVGRWAIKFAMNLMSNQMQQRKMDATIIGYAVNTITVALNIVLAIVLLGVFGIETTSFAAFIAAAGFAIGAAWGGLLGNLAAGAFLIVLRPFKTGDMISAGGVTGKVVEIGLFVTTYLTPDNVITFVGNSKILGSTVKNYSASDSRRVEMMGTLHHSDNVEATMAEVRARLLKIPNVLTEPAPEVNIHAFNEWHLTLAIRPYTHSDHYFQVQFDTAAAMRGLLVGVRPHGHGFHADGEEGEESEGAEGGEEEEE